MPNTLEENVNRVKAAASAISAAITSKGGTVTSGDGLEDFASDIATIPSGGGGDGEYYNIISLSGDWVRSNTVSGIIYNDETMCVVEITFNSRTDEPTGITKSFTITYPETFTPLHTTGTGLMVSTGTNKRASSVSDISVNTVNHTITGTFGSISTTLPYLLRITLTSD